MVELRRLPPEPRQFHARCVIAPVAPCLPAPEPDAEASWCCCEGAPRAGDGLDIVGCNGGSRVGVGHGGAGGVARDERSGGMGSGRGGAVGVGGGERSGAMGSMASGAGMLELSSGSMKGDDGLAVDRRMEAAYCPMAARHRRVRGVAAGQSQGRSRTTQ